MCRTRGISFAVFVPSFRKDKNMDSIFAPSESSSLPNSIFKAKVMLLGDHAVGKSAIANRYIRNYFDEARHVELS